jgi:predicted flap endonuclease-1-like 5' DNA nuclease
VADGHGPEDNLRLIKGIGPKFETLLRARNITSFSQIASLIDDAEWETYLDTFAGRIEREQWREQATDLLGESEN